MNLALNKVVRPWGAGRNLNDFRDGTNTEKLPKEKIRLTCLERKILQSCHSNPKRNKSACAET